MKTWNVKNIGQSKPLTKAGLLFCVATLCLPAFAAPNAPTNLLASAASATQINLSWADDSSNEDGFKIERSVVGVNFSQIAQVLPNTTIYRDTGAWPGTAYSYRVCAYASGGNSAYGGPVAVATPAACLNTVVSWGSSTPPGLTGLVAVDAGGNDSLAVKSDGTLIGWGADDYGKATPPAGLTGMVAVAAGAYHSLALKGDGTVVGWGYNYSGEATPPGGLTNAVAIAAGGAHSLALKNDGTVAGWGYNAYGQASPPSGLRGVVAISAGEEHSLALKSDGTVVAWGHNQYGQASVSAGLTNVVAIAAGDWHSLALQADGTIVGWGYSYGGETTPPVGLTGVVAIGAGDYFSIALKNDGTVVGWGYPRATTSPAGLTGVTSVAVGFGHCVALTCAPYASSNLVASAVSSNQVDLAWVDIADTEDGFNIERAPDSNGVPGAWASLATVGSNVTNYSDTGVSPSTRYWYRVQAYNAGGNSPYGNQASAVTPPLSSPTGLKATAVSGFQINLTWMDNSLAEQGFKIERAPDNGGVAGSWAVISTVGANVTNYSDPGLTETTRYWYRVRAYNADADSPASNETSATTQLGAPSNLIATPVFTNRIDLSWTDTSGSEDGFRVYRATSTNDQMSLLIATNLPNVTTCSDTAAVASVTYYYRVRAFKAQLYSAYSAWTSANTATADSDGDGLADLWMLKYFGHPTAQASDKSRATDDPDGDGMSNLAEYLAGTNPTNGASYLHLTSLTLTGDDVAVNWTTVGGKSYVVQTNSALGGGFADFSPVITMPGTGETVTNRIDPGARTNWSNRFYRIRLAQ